jgi:hypothetical protein
MPRTYQEDWSPKTKIKHIRGSLQTPGGRSFFVDKTKPATPSEVLNYANVAPTSMLSKRNFKQEKALLAKMSEKTHELRRLAQKNIEPKTPLHDPMPVFKADN